MPETIGDRLVRGDKGSFLDGLGNAAGAVVGGFYRIGGTRALKDALHGTWPLRHPLHPAVTDAVVGGYTIVALLDVVYLVTGDAALFRATDIALVASLIFSLGALASGLTDWNETYGNERRLGVLHGTLMLLISVGYLISLWLRVGGGSRDAAIGLGLACWVLLGITSYLGGEMSFGFGTGVDRLAWSEVGADWETLELRADGLEERKVVRARMSNGFALAVVKLDGAVRAIGAVCTHASGPLDEGELVGADGCDVKCPWHGSVFSFRSGSARHGPATMDEPAFETRVAADGRVEVKLRS